MLRALKKSTLLLCLLGSALLLQGCFWGLFGGSIKVQNETDATIYVSIDQNNLGDGGYYPHSTSINAGDTGYMPLHSFTFDPDVWVECRDVERKYHTSLDFLGFDIIHVAEEDFLHASN